MFVSFANPSGIRTGDRLWLYLLRWEDKFWINFVWNFIKATAQNFISLFSFPGRHDWIWSRAHSCGARRYIHGDSSCQRLRFRKIPDPGKNYVQFHKLAPLSLLNVKSNCRAGASTRDQILPLGTACGFAFSWQNKTIWIDSKIFAIAHDCSSNPLHREKLKSCARAQNEVSVQKQVA